MYEFYKGCEIVDRTYNFQVDNGLFVAEYYLDKPYEDIAIQDLKDNVEVFAKKLKMYKESNTIVNMTHYNSYLTQKGKDIEDQMNELVDNVGHDKNCMICGKKLVNIDLDIAYTSLVYGVASPGKFANRSNNMKTIDVCPVCMYLSLLSFINTQKMGLAVLYNSDSDDFMRDITEDIQNAINTNIMLDIEGKDIDKKFIETMDNIKIDKQIYDDLNYIELVKYSNNPQSPYVINLEISDKDLKLINKIKYAGLIQEFYDRYLFNAISKGINPIKYLIKKSCSLELYNILKEDYMTKKEIKLVENMTDKLIDINGNGALKDLKMTKGKNDFKRFLIKYSDKIDLCNNMGDYNEVIENFYDYKDYLILNLNLKGDK